MKQNGNKIRYMKYKGSLKLAAAVLAVSLAFPMAAQAKAWDFENGSYVDALVRLLRGQWQKVLP